MALVDKLKEVNQFLARKGFEPYGIAENEDMFRDLLREIRSAPLDVDTSEGERLEQLFSFLNREQSRETSQETQARENVLRDIVQQQIERVFSAIEAKPELVYGFFTDNFVEPVISFAAKKYKDKLPDIIGPSTTNDVYDLFNRVSLNTNILDASSPRMRKERLKHMAEMAKIQEVPFRAYQRNVDHYISQLNDVREMPSMKSQFDFEGLKDLHELLKSVDLNKAKSDPYRSRNVDRAEQLRDALNFDDKNLEAADKIVDRHNDVNASTVFYDTLATLQPHMFMDELVKGPSSKLFARAFSPENDRELEAGLNIDHALHRHLNTLIDATSPAHLNRRTYDPIHRHFVEKLVQGATPENKQHISNIIQSLGSRHDLGDQTAQFLLDHLENTGEDLVGTGTFHSDEMMSKYRRVQVRDAVRNFNDNPTTKAVTRLANTLGYSHTKRLGNDVIRDILPTIKNVLSSSVLDKLSSGERQSWNSALRLMHDHMSEKLFPTLLHDAVETKDRDLFRGLMHPLESLYSPESLIGYKTVDGKSVEDMEDATNFLQQMHSELQGEYDQDPSQPENKFVSARVAESLLRGYGTKSGKIIVPNDNRAINVDKEHRGGIATMAVKPTSSGLRAIRARLKELGGKLSIKDVSAKLNPFRRTEAKESLVDDWSPFEDENGTLSVEKLNNYKELVSTTPQARSVVPKIDRLIEHIQGEKSRLRSEHHLKIKDHEDQAQLLELTFGKKVPEAEERVEQLYRELDQIEAKVKTSDLPPQLKSSPSKKKVVNYNTVLDWDKVSKSGNVDAKKLDEAIESIPDAQVGYHTGNFVLGMQEHSMHDQRTLVLDVTPQQVEHMKKEGLWSDYRLLSDQLPTDLHPQNRFGLGWVRWSEAGDKNHPTDPMHIHIDEVQSDWDDMVKKAVKNSNDHAPLNYASNPNWHNGYLDSAEIKRREDNTAKLLENYGKIRKILFHGVEPGELLHEAFHQHIRNSLDVETKPVFWSVWSKDSKKKMRISSLDTNRPPPIDWFTNYHEKPMAMGAVPDKYAGSAHTTIDHPSIKDAPFVATSQTSANLKDEPTFTGKIHKKEQDFDREEIKLGVKTEMEHTDSAKEALKIALDHLKEDPRYYSKAKECGLLDKAEPLFKSEPDDFFHLFQTDNDPAIHNAMRGLHPETGAPHIPTSRAWKDTIDYITHVPEAKSGLIRYLMRNPDNQEHIDLLKQLVKSNGVSFVRKMADDFNRLTGQNFREYMAKHYVPHVLADSGNSADEEILEDILAHHHDQPSVLAAMKGTNAPVHNVSILGTLANTVYKNDPEKMFNDFKVDQQAVRKLPVNGQLGYIAHAMLNHDTAHGAQKLTMLSNVSSIMDELRNKSSSVDAKIGQMVRKHNIHPSNAILNRIASTSPDPSALGMQLGVKVGSAALRKLRDHIESLGKDVLPNELPTGQRWSTITAPITDRQGNVNYVLDWNPLRERNGKISAASVQKYIDSMPTRYYDTAVVPYESDKQNHSTKPQYVFRLKITDEDFAKLRATGADRTLQKLTDLGKQSGHPVDDKVVGWIRYTPGEDGNHFIDESQTDLDTNFESSLRQQLKQYYGGNVPEEAYRANLRRVREMFPEAHVQQIKDLVFGKKASSEVLHEAWQQHMRQSGHVGAVWHGHSSTTKAPMADMDMGATLPGHMKVHYEETPKALGATPANYGTIEAESAPTYEHLTNARIHGDKVRKFEE